MTDLLAKLSIIAAFATLVSGCNYFDSDKTEDKLGRELQTILDDIVEKNEAVPGAALYVEMHSLGFSWGGAAGFADLERKIQLTPQNPVRIASNTKTFVATAILRLYEEGLVDLDSSIDRYLSADSLLLLKKDGYRPEEIKIRHLLTHTGGLFDYAESKEYLERYEADVRHRWTRMEQIQGAMDWGDPYGAPGEAFHYSDTGYILLGEILERVSGEPLGSALRTLIGYEALGLASTWLETMENSPPDMPDRAHQYEGDFDTYAIDPSIDLYGGGGLVSTVGDLARFMEAVFTGRVFTEAATIETMLSTGPVENDGSESDGVHQLHGRYCMGIEVTEIDSVVVYQNFGYWGTLAAFVPSLDLSIGATINQHERDIELLNAILSRVLKMAGEFEINE